MKATLWILLVTGLGAAVYFTNFADLGGTTSLVARVASAAAAATGALALWLTRGSKHAS